MTDDEQQIRSLYLFLACSQAIDQCRERLAGKLPASASTMQPVFEKMMKKELGLLFRYWATQRIWKAFDASETDGKNFNLAVLRQFFEGLRLPKDGSGLRYAELLSVPEQVTELYRRLGSQLGVQSEIVLKELQHELPAWHALVTTYTDEALRAPLARLSSTIKAWAGRSHAPAQPQ